MPELILMFCGPHRDRAEWSPMDHRIRRAIGASRERAVPLVVAGDSFDGRDVRHFAELARGSGVRVAGVYNDGMRTLTDAQAFLRFIDERDMARKEALRVGVVTDAFHMARAMAYLCGETERLLPGRHLSFLPVPVTDGPSVSEDVIRNEARGLRDYLERPGAYRPRGDPLGKPTHGRVEAGAVKIVDFL